MKIYVAHSKTINYVDDLYKPLRNFEILQQHELILPHEFQIDNCHDRCFYKSLDLFLAEVSEPATGLGMELAFAYDDGLPIYCLHKKGTKVKNSVRMITDKIFEYQSVDDLLIIVSEIVKKHEAKKDLIKNNKSSLC